jgi:peptide chain release factor 1
MDFKKLKEKYSLEKTSSQKQKLEQEVTKNITQDVSETVAKLNEQTELYNLISELYNKIDRFEQTEEVINSEKDGEFVELAKKEKEELEEDIKKLEIDIKNKMFEKKLEDPDDNKSIILEIRAGAGGQESSIFAGDLFRMYSQYANSKNWQINLIDSSPSEAGGFKEIIAQISGKNVYKKMKYESGVHRVQRIPKTESSGRIHTSTVSVAVLPEAKEIDVKINPEDLRIDVMRSSGAGGQSVNKTDSAIRITHLPTGIVVSCQETKYQQQNKDKAMAILRSRLYEKRKEEAHQKRDSLRLSQIGSAMRAEKIRTYNYPQSRITDHRVKKSWHNLEEILNGSLEDLMNDLSREITNLQIQEMEKGNE